MILNGTHEPVPKPKWDLGTHACPQWDLARCPKWEGSSTGAQT